MKILIADKVAPKLVQDLQALGAEIVLQPDLSPEALPAAAADARILIVRSKQVTAETIAAGRPLSLIVRAGAGVNTIDIEAASRHGTYVANCPGKNTAAVAELAIGLLIACDRGIADATQALREGRWQKRRFGKGLGLKTRTLGIIGVGAIGGAVARRAQALEMKIVAWSRSLTPAEAEARGFEFAATPLDVARRADAVSVHLAAAAATKGLIGAAFFAAMKPGAIFVNTARGDVVDHEALREAIRDKGIKAGLDVFANEPVGGDASFDQTELAARVVCTPHIGASTEQSEDAIAEETVHIVETFLRTGSPPNVVNVRAVTGAAGATLVIRHHNRVGVLARVLGTLRDEGVNIEEMQNRIFRGDATAACAMTLDKRPTVQALARLGDDADIIEVTAGP